MLNSNGIFFTKYTIFLISVLLFVSTVNVRSELPRPDEECDKCQRVLYTAFVWFQRAKSRRMLRHKLKHVCKRYFEYRRHCLSALLPNIDRIATEMESALTIPDGRYKPMRTCQLLKECDKNQPPIELLTLISSTNMTFAQMTPIE